MEINMNDEEKEVEELTKLIDKTKIDTQYSSEPESVCIARAILKEGYRKRPSSGNEDLGNDNVSQAQKDAIFRPKGMSVDQLKKILEEWSTQWVMGQHHSHDNDAIWLEGYYPSFKTLAQAIKNAIDIKNT